MEIQKNGGIYRKSLEHFSHPFASGSDREAFYSRKYNLVFKVSLNRDDESQTKEEYQFFESVIDEYKSIIPIIAFVEYDGMLWTVSKKIRTASSFGLYRNLRYDQKAILRYATQHHFIIPNFKLVVDFLEHYRYLGDLHASNWGFDKEWNIHIIDCGL